MLRQGRPMGRKGMINPPPLPEINFKFEYNPPPQKKLKF